MPKGKPPAQQAGIMAIATAVPDIVVAQGDVERLGARVFAGRAGEFSRLRAVYANAGIATRHSCVPLDWYAQPHGWSERNALYTENAVALLEQAAVDCLAQADVAADEVDGIIVVSTTGIATPSLDAHLMARMPFRHDVQRLPIFGLGCVGGAVGLARAAALAQAEPGSRWLLLVVELCGLTFRAGDASNSNVVATALFGDGAAAILLDSQARGTPKVVAWGEHTWPDSLDVMGWHVENDGLGVLFSRDIPHLVRRDYRAAVDAFLLRAGVECADVDHFVLHPGGAKVLKALADALDLPSAALAHAAAVLREYGNMSAPTVLFVLARAFADGMSGRTLLGALGPGFTAGFVLLEDGE